MSTLAEKLKAPGIPLWVTAYMFVVIAFGVVLGIPALFDNGFAELQTVGWGGREFGVAVGAILAVAMKTAHGYFIIFVIGIFRELSDALEALAETPANTASAVMVAVFIVIGAACAWRSLLAIREQSSTV